MKKYIAYFIILFVPMVSFGLPRYIGALKQTTRMPKEILTLLQEGTKSAQFDLMTTSIGATIIVKDVSYPMVFSVDPKNITGVGLNEANHTWNFEGPLLWETQNKIGEHLPEFSHLLERRNQTNLRTAPGSLPLFGSRQADLPIEGKIEITKQIITKLASSKNLYVDAAKRNFLVNIPEQVIWEGGQMPVEALDSLRNFYRERLQLTLNNIKREGKVRLGDWQDAMQVVLDLGFFGTAEDAAAIAEFAKIVPEDLVPLTELNVIVALLNLNDPVAYKELHNLASVRMQSEHWFDSVPQEDKKSLNAHLVAAQYIQLAKDTLDPIASGVYPRSFANSELQPWISRFLPGDEDFARYASEPHQEENTAYYTAMLRKYGSKSMTYFLNQGDTPRGIQTFLRAKQNMSASLVVDVLGGDPW